MNDPHAHSSVDSHCIGASVPTRAEKKVTITNLLGLHVRPSAAIAGLARNYSSSFSIMKDGETIDGKSSMDLLTLAAIQGTELTLIAEGEDAETLVARVAELIENKFGEE